RESPMRTSACRIFPSGPAARDTSSAPRAFLYHSIACAALSRVSCGVTVWYPSGTAFFAFVISTSFGSKPRVLHCVVCDVGVTCKLMKIRLPHPHCLFSRGWLAIGTLSLAPTACSGSGVDRFVLTKAPVVALTHIRVIDGTGRP